MLAGGQRGERADRLLQHLLDLLLAARERGHGGRLEGRGEEGRAVCASGEELLHVIAGLGLKRVAQAKAEELAAQLGEQPDSES